MKLSDEIVKPVAEIQVPDFKPKKAATGRRWERCIQCKEQVLIEVNGLQYYHRITCKLSNGVKYKKDRL